MTRLSDSTINLHVKVLEYEHVLQHVIKCASCGDCKKVAQGALDGLNADDFFDYVLDQIERGRFDPSI